MCFLNVFLVALKNVPYFKTYVFIIMIIIYLKLYVCMYFTMKYCFSFFFPMSIPQNLYFCIIALWVSISRVSRDFLIIIFQMFFGVDCFPPWLQFRTPRVSSVEWVLFSFFFFCPVPLVCAPLFRHFSLEITSARLSGEWGYY